MTIAFVTFGCRLNHAETLDLQTKFAAAGHEIVPLPSLKSPDVIIVRGCSVTARAQRDCEKKIAHLRAQFPTSRVIISGCLPNAQKIDDFMGSVPTNLQPSTFNIQPTSRAYLKVQDGCSGRCAFCIVPQFRGPPRSESFSDVLARARRFLADGYREIVVTGCNLALYHSEGHGLPDLLSALAELQPSTNRHRIRLGSLEPGICDAALLDAMETHPNVCRHVHLSLQSGSNAVLARMNRPYRIEQVAAFCADAVRRLGPRLALGADVICGFPGETESDFEATRAFLNGTCRSALVVPNQTQTPHPSPTQTPTTQTPPTQTPPTQTPPTPNFPFAHLHAFPYSERPGTPAADMDGALPRAVRLERVRILEEDAKKRADAFRAQLMGQEVEICVEKDGTGYSSEYVRFPAPEGAERRSLVIIRG